MKIAQNFLSVVRTNTLENLKHDLEQSQKYNMTLSNLNDDIRGFKHDFANIITAIGGYVQAEDIEGLKKYYSGLMSDCSKLNNLSMLSPAVVNNPGVYSLLSSKYYIAEEKGITINLDIFLNLNELNMKIYEFIRILRYLNGQCH